MVVLLPHCGFLSETTRMLHIARALQERGVSIRMASHGGPYQHVLDRAGMPYTLLPPVMDKARALRFVQDTIALGRPGVNLLDLDETMASARAEAEFLRANNAQVVVTGFTITATLSSRMAGIPLVTSHGGSMVPPVLEAGLAPAPLQNPIRFLDWAPRSWARRIANWAPPRMKAPVAFLNRAAKQLGVEPVPSLAALMLGDLTLVTEHPEVLGINAQTIQAWRPSNSPSYRPGTQLVCTGPLFARLDSAADDHIDDTWWDRFDGRPVVYVALTSATESQVRAAIRRVQDSGARVVVASTLHDVSDLQGPDICVGSVLPSHQIMPRVDLAVTMGGQGSVQTAMACGTPLIAIPLHPEQELNVALMVRQGAGMGLAPRHLDSPRLTRMVRDISSKPHYRAAAARVQRLYASVDGAALAANAIMSLLR